MTQYTTKALDENTWTEFARLVEANNGVWGGCWCMWYHGKKESADDDSPAVKRKAKKCLVEEGRAHASLVYDGDDCVGWCQFGSAQELPRIHNERAYLATEIAPPHWRITCFFSGKGHRGNGVASVALEGAVEQIRKLGGGRIEAFPESTESRKASPAFLFNGALSTFERQGFKRAHQIGKHKWVVTRTVRKASKR